MAVTTFLIMLVGCVVFAHSTHLRGEFGGQRFEIDVEFSRDIMTVVMHKPVDAPDTFRETTNLHIFSKHLVAMKNAMDRECYVRYFVESEDQMKGRVENAEYNNGRMGNVSVERLVLDGIPPLSNRTVHVLFGSKIASFCSDYDGSYDVFAIGDEDFIVLDPTDLKPKNRVRRGSKKYFEVAGTCCCGCCCGGGDVYQRSAKQ